jgi:predicted PurR-regulated permease PerM
MNIKTKKIIAKEILILLAISAITVLFFCILNLNNTYQRYHNKSLTKDFNSNQNKIDSLNKQLLDFNNKDKFISNIYNQYGRLNNNKNNEQNGLPIGFPILPKGFKLDEKIGEIEDDNGFVDVLGLLSFKYILINFDKKNETPIKYDGKKFTYDLLNSNKFRNEIYEKLKTYYNDVNCNTLEKFENKIGIVDTIKINNIQSDLKILYTENGKLQKDISNTVENSIEKERIIKFSINFFFALFILFFILRYIYYVGKWSISTLKS